MRRPTRAEGAQRRKPAWQRPRPPLARTEQTLLCSVRASSPTLATAGEDDRTGNTLLAPVHADPD